MRPLEDLVTGDGRTAIQSILFQTECGGDFGRALALAEERDSLS